MDEQLNKAMNNSLSRMVQNEQNVGFANCSETGRMVYSSNTFYRIPDLFDRKPQLIKPFFIIL